MKTDPAPALRQAADDPVTGRLVFLGCSRRKLTTRVPVPALELYQGGCVPALRDRVAASPAHRARLRILSAQHGMVGADTLLLPYDRPMTYDRVDQLRPAVHAKLIADVAAYGVPRHILVLAGPMYLELIVGAFSFAGPEPRPRLTWIATTTGWSVAAAVLDEWGWP